MDNIRVKFNNMEEIESFVDTCKDFRQRVELKQGRYIVDAKSILGVLSLRISEPMVVEIITIDKNIKNMFESAMRRFLA